MSAQGSPNNELPILIGDFLSSLEAEGRSAHTARCYRSDLKHLVDYVSTLHAPLDRQAAAGYEAWLRRNRRAAVATQHRRLAAARRFIGYLANTGHADGDLADAVQSPGATPGPAPPPSSEDVRLVLEAPDLGTRIGRRDHVMFALMALHGLAPNEVCSLRWRHFDAAKHTLSVPGRARAFTIYDRYLAEDLSRLKAESSSAKPNGPIFLSRRGGALTTCGLGQRVEYYCEVLGDRLGERLTPRRLRDFATATAALRAEAEDIEGLATQLGYQDMGSARRRWRQAWDHREQILLENQIPIEQAANSSGVALARLRGWVEEGMPHSITEGGQVMVSLAAVQEWGSRPAPAGRRAPLSPSGPTADGEDTERPLPPIGEAMLRLMGVTTREDFQTALDALAETDIPRVEPDVRAQLERIARQSLRMAAAVDAALDHDGAAAGFLTYVAALLRDVPEAKARLAGAHETLDETFTALRSGLIERSPLLRAHDAAVRTAYGHDQRLLAAVERRVAGGDDLPGSERAPRREDESSDPSNVEATPEARPAEPFFQQLALALVDTPHSFSMWRELQPGFASAGLVLMMVSLFAEELVELAEGGAAYYGLPDDDRTGLAAWGG